MATTHDIPKLDNKGLRSFGFSTGAIVAVLFGILIPWIVSSNYPYWPWIVFLAFLMPAIAAPKLLAPVYTNWMKFGLLLGRITTPIILCIVFTLVFLPMGIALKLFGKDPMDRKLQANAKSYRCIRRELEPNSMEKPF